MFSDRVFILQTQVLYCPSLPREHQRLLVVVVRVAVPVVVLLAPQVLLVMEKAGVPAVVMFWVALLV